MKENSLTSLVADRAVDPHALVEDLVTTRLAVVPRQFFIEGMGLYLLVDPMLGDPVLPTPPEEGLEREALNAARADAWQRPTFALNLPPVLNLDAALAPYLIELSGPEDSWMLSSLQWAVDETVQSWLADHDQPIPHRVGGWLQSAAFGSELATTLSACLALSTRARTSARYLRLADRRVLSLAVHVLGETAAMQHLSPLQHWHWLDAHAAWRCLSASPKTEPGQAAHASATGSPLATFTLDQWGDMALGEAVHTHMAQSIRQRLARDDTPHPSQWMPVDAAQWQAALARK